MAKKTVVQSKVVLDPHFIIPVGAEDLFTYADAELGDGTNDDGDTDVSVSDDGSGNVDDSIDISDDGDSDVQTDDVLGVPQNLAVVDQTLVRAPGGQNSIDVVIQVDDVDGADNYEIQVTKA